MRKTIVILLAVLALAGCSGKTPVAQTPPAVTPVVTPAVTKHAVVYESEAPDSTTARTATYTLRSDDGGTRQGEFDLPLRNQNGTNGLTFTGFGSGAFVYLSIQNGDEYGSVSCRITVDGAVISENSSDGGFTIATCQGQVP